MSTKLTMFLICILGLLLRSASADPGLVTTIVLTPSDVGSLSTTQFTTLPTADPTLFGFGMTGASVQKVDFDFDPDGNPILAPIDLTDEYSSIGVLMNHIRVSSTVAGGAASPPNATTTVPENPDFQVFTFTVPVLEAGIINTTPDAQVYDFFDENGNLLASVTDPGNADIDTFIGAKVSSGSLIKTFRITRINYAMELDELIFTPVLAAIQVPIDIKPGSDPNSINLKSNDVVPVAILSTIAFEATVVDPDTVLFADAFPVKWTMEDVNQDGEMDLLLHLRTQDLNLAQDSTEATLTGETMDGTPIEGTDSVNIVPKKKK
jgi:hypothetical protein